MPHSDRHETATLLVTSGKGGVGTSMIAALTALTAAKVGASCSLTRGVERNLHHLFGVRPTHSLWMLSHPRIQANDALVTIDETPCFCQAVRAARLSRRPATTTVAPPLTDSPRSIPSSIRAFDGGSRLDTITAISESADPAVLLVTSADRLSLAANYALVKSVRTRRSNTVISVVANRSGEDVSAAACEYLVDACAHFLGRSITIAGSIPDDPCLQAAVAAGMTVRDALVGAPAADAMRAVLAVVLPSCVIPSPSSSRRWS
jgi:MinD-like ATPase involved in chromosome partitioning or flagellar assembly